jgi:acetyltransferase-like isoleucine patch superfamily enzyme
MMGKAWIHPTALVEEGATIGQGTRIWDNVHLRRGAQVGRSCIIGEKTYVACQAVIGDFVKVNASVYICAAVTIEDFCMIAAHAVFTNDRFPRAGNRELTDLETSDPTDETLATKVRRGTTIGANATVGPGIELGEFSMIGMASVVTRSVPAFALAAGNPARQIGWVCICGHPVERWGRESANGRPPEDPRRLSCRKCERGYLVTGDTLRILGDP